MPAVSRRSSWDQYPFPTLSCDSQRDSNPYEARSRVFLAPSPHPLRTLSASSPQHHAVVKPAFVERRSQRIRAHSPRFLDRFLSPGQILAAPFLPRIVQPRPVSHHDCSRAPLFHDKNLRSRRTTAKLLLRVLRVISFHDVRSFSSPLDHPRISPNFFPFNEHRSFSRDRVGPQKFPANLRYRGLNANREPRRG